MLIKKRHSFGCFLFRTVGRIVGKLKYNYKYTPCKEKGPFLILGNHSTAADPLLYSVLFPQRVYVLIADEMLRTFYSGAINYFLGAVQTTKSVKDTSSVKKLITIAKQNYSIGIFPEGATTYDGTLCHIDPSIVKLAKKINFDLALVNVTGGYQTAPKFAKKARKGEVNGFVKTIIRKEELASMSNDELYDTIVSNLTVDLVKRDFKSNERAECLENTIYYCHNCDSFDTYTSRKNNFYCTKCNTSYFLNKDLSVEGNMASIKDLYDVQKEKINTLTLDDINNLVYKDNAKFVEIIGNKKIKKYSGNFKLENSILEIGDYKIPLSEITSSCTTGSHMVDIFFNNKIYQLIGDEKFSALKYMNIIYRYINLVSNNESKYLGV